MLLYSYVTIMEIKLVVNLRFGLVLLSWNYSVLSWKCPGIYFEKLRGRPIFEPAILIVNGASSIFNPGPTHFVAISLAIFLEPSSNVPNHLGTSRL